MTDTAPAKKAAPAAQRVAAPLTTPAFNPPAIDPLVEEERAPRAYDVGDTVEFTDSIKFQFGNQKTYQRGEVVGVVEGDGMLIVAVGMQDEMMYSAPRVEYIIDGKDTTTMRKVEVPDGE